MQESGHVGILTLVEIVFVNHVNQGWVGNAQDLHRKTGCDEYGKKHVSFVLNLFGRRKLKYTPWRSALGDH